MLCNDIAMIQINIAATMKYRANELSKEKSNVETTTKTDLEDVALSMHIKEEPDLVHLVRSELDQSVKKEAVDDDREHVDQQRYVQNALTSVGVASMNVSADSAGLGDLLNIKDEMADCPIMLQCMDSLNATKQQKMVVGRQESTVNDYDNDEVPTCRVKDEIDDDKCIVDDTDEQATAEAANSIEQLGLLLKEELEDTDLDIGPTVFQHMDSHYRSKQADLHGFKPEFTIAKLDPDKVQSGTEDGPGPRSQIKHGTVESSPKDIGYKCQQCPKRFKSKNVLKKHVKRLHATGVSHSCPKCDKEFKVRFKLMIHIQRVHSKQRYECDICNKVYKSKQTLNNHVLKVHTDNPASIGNKYNKCNKCLKTCKTSWALLKHIHKFHGTGVSHKCPKCDETFEVRCTLLAHIRNVHNNQQHECHICEKVYKSKRSLELHVLRHHSHEPADNYKCDKCMKSYKSKNSLNTHFKQIHGAESHKCAECGKEFKSRSYLNSHVYYRHSKNHYECDICKKVYKSKRPMIKHLSKPSSCNPARHPYHIYACDYCTKTFKHKYNIQVHIASVHNDVTYKCSQCEKNFKSKQYFSRHIARCNLRQHTSWKHNDYGQQSAALDDEQVGSDIATSTILDSEDEAYIIIKQEPGDTDLDIGPTLLQHMDSYYAFNQVKLKRLKMETSTATDEQIVKNEADSSIKED